MHKHGTDAVKKGTLVHQVMEITAGLGTKLSGLVEANIKAATERMENRLKQLREQLAAVKTDRHMQTTKLKTERDQARSELGQAKRTIDNLSKEVKAHKAKAGK